MAAPESRKGRLYTLAHESGAAVTEKLGESRLVAAFRDADPVAVDSYDALFRYFVGGWARYRSPLGAVAHYPGWRSWSGRHVDALEGFARIMPLFAAWVHGGRAPEIRLASGESVNLAAAFRAGLLAGTDPASGEYWGDIRDRDQRIVEAADIALALWLFRDTVWQELTAAQRAQVARWLSQVDGRRTHDNNWHLFVVLVERVLHTLGLPITDSSARRRYARVKEFYRGDGWFSDGEHGSFDYYNAWGFHYALFWLDEIDPHWDPGFLRDVRAAFLENYRYLIGPEGFPMLGRSSCYRFAAPAPLVFGHSSCPELVSAGQARRALDCTWRYFLNHGALSRGTVTQGYFGADARILENYSGPASSLWSLRSLIPAFYLPDQAQFWRDPPDQLPVETGDYCFRVPATGWTIRGVQKTRTITIETPAPLPPRETRLASYGLLGRLLGLMYRSPHRPENYGAKYRRRYYSSAEPLCNSSSLRIW